MVIIKPQISDTILDQPSPSAQNVWFVGLHDLTHKALKQGYVYQVGCYKVPICSSDKGVPQYDWKYHGLLVWCYWGDQIFTKIEYHVEVKWLIPDLESASSIGQANEIAILKGFSNIMLTIIGESMVQSLKKL